MKEILETLIKSLVENKEDVKINEREDGNTTVYEVSVNPSDMGKVIGRQGKVAKSIRTIMKSISGKEHKKVVVEFVD